MNTPRFSEEKCVIYTSSEPSHWGVYSNQHELGDGTVPITTINPSSERCSKTCNVVPLLTGSERICDKQKTYLTFIISPYMSIYVLIKSLNSFLQILIIDQFNQSISYIRSKIPMNFDLVGGFKPSEKIRQLG